jgi:hypothetical protein
MSRPTGDTAEKKRSRRKLRRQIVTTVDDPFTLYFPIEIEGVIGLKANQINAFKKQGLPFVGKKTCVAWVRDFITKLASSKIVSTNHPVQSRISTST